MAQAVLVVDDDPLIRKVSRRALERATFDVAVAGSIEEATTLIRSRPFDMAFLDYFLQNEECGCHLIAQLRVHNPSIRIAVVSGLGHLSTLIRHAYASGADLVVSKAHVDWVDLTRLDRTPPPQAQAEVDLWTMRRELIHGAVLVHRRNVSDAARALGINRTSLYRVLQKTPLPNLDEEDE